jgi:hypothetical protein
MDQFDHVKASVFKELGLSKGPPAGFMSCGVP